MIVPFSDLLRARSRRAGARATDPGTGSGAGASRPGETGFFADLAAGRCEVADYAELLAQYAFLHDALERATVRAAAADPVVRPFVADRRSRLTALHADLEFLVGPDWSEIMSPLPATLRAIRRICVVANEWPAGVVAHHYVRFRGEPAGGPNVGRHLAEQFGFDTNGIGFFLLDEIADPEGLVRTYRDELDAAPWDEDERARIVAEAAVAVELDDLVLAQLDAGRGGAADGFGRAVDQAGSARVALS